MGRDQESRLEKLREGLDSIRSTSPHVDPPPGPEIRCDQMYVNDVGSESRTAVTDLTPRVTFPVPFACGACGLSLPSREYLTRRGECPRCRWRSSSIPSVPVVNPVVRAPEIPDSGPLSPSSVHHAGDMYHTPNGRVFISDWENWLLMGEPMSEIPTGERNVGIGNQIFPFTPSGYEHRIPQSGGFPRFQTAMATGSVVYSGALFPLSRVAEDSQRVVVDDSESNWEDEYDTDDYGGWVEKTPVVVQRVMGLGERKLDLGD